jgi:hypothetical protein
MIDTLNRWSCSIPCICTCGKSTFRGDIVELSFARALVARPSSIPPLGSRVTVELGSECEGVTFSGEIAFVQEKKGGPFGIQLFGKPEHNVDKLRRLLPFCSHPSIGRVRGMPEKRRFYRWNVAIPAQFRCENRVTTCTAVEISYGGARLETSEVPPERTELELTLPCGERTKSIKARIVHRPTDSGPSSYQVQFGVEFLARSDEKKHGLVPLLQGCSGHPVQSLDLHEAPTASAKSPKMSL